MIIVPDMPGAGRGRHALFSWQTILALRILRELHERFGAEVGTWKPAIDEFRQLIKGRSFPGLWSTVAAFPDRDHARLVEDRAVLPGAWLTLPLAPHMQAIAQDFALPSEPQLPLFPAVGLRRCARLMTPAIGRAALALQWHLYSKMKRRPYPALTRSFSTVPTALSSCRCRQRSSGAGRIRQTGFGLATSRTM